MKCVKCGMEIPDGSNFCNFCGDKQITDIRNESGVKSKKKKGKKKTRVPNGAGAVYKMEGRRSKKWAARLTDGTWVGSFKTEAEGRQALNCIKASGIRVTNKFNMTFAEVYAEWSPGYFKRLGKSGISDMKRAYDVFSPLHDRKFRDLRADDFQAIIDKYYDMGRKKSTLKKYKTLVNQMSEWAIKNDIIMTNYAHYIEFVPGNDEEETIPYSEEDIQKLKEDGSETAMIVLMLIYTGMRPNELFELPLENYLDHRDDYYVIGGSKTEAGRNRSIPIRPEGKKYFDYFADRADMTSGSLLISGYSGNRVYENFLKRDYYPLRDKLGIAREKTPGCGRSTYATWARTHGIEEDMLQKMLGHTRYNVTYEHYVKPDGEQYSKALKRAERTETAEEEENIKAEKSWKNK